MEISRTRRLEKVRRLEKQEDWERNEIKTKQTQHRQEIGKERRLGEQGD